MPPQKSEMHPDDPEHDAELIEQARDDKIDEARTSILDFFTRSQGEVFYERQLTVIFERSYFHWITVKALLELAAGGSISSQMLELMPEVPIRFFWARGNRYWKRQAARVMGLVRRFSATAFTHALGSQGELLVDAALPLAGFAPIARNVRSFNDRTWIASGHNLDRIVQREGIYYGVEIKNTLPYIPRDEFRIKLAICAHLGLTPLFVSRMAPKNYNYEIIERGGVSWILGSQFYPFGQEELAEAIRQQLRLPVESPIRIEDGAVARLVKALAWQARRTKA
jgi:predicted RecB family endonuclease